MKTILFLIPSLGGGGAERVLVNLVNNLDKSKYRISVQTLFDIGVNRQYLNNDIEYIPGFKKMISGNVRIFKVFSPKILYCHIVKKKYDIVVSYLEGITARIISGCPYSNSKLISWIHGEQKSKEVASYPFKSYDEAQKCYNRFNINICVADSVKKDFCSIFPLNKNCKVLYNINENSEIIKKSKEKTEDFEKPEEITIFSVGRLIKEKGYDRLINVHKRLLAQGKRHQIFILGEGTERENLEQKIQDNGVSTTFHLLGFQNNPYKYIAQADLFICSSRREGFSTAVTEALILGIPVVSTSCSGAYELLGQNNEYGLVTENSEEGIYEGMYQMLNSSEFLKYYKTKAVERGKYFSKEKTVKAVEEMLDTL